MFLTEADSEKFENLMIDDYIPIPKGKIGDKKWQLLAKIKDLLMDVTMTFSLSDLRTLIYVLIEKDMSHWNR